MLAAMRVCADVFDSRMGEQDDAERAHVRLEGLEFGAVKGLVPADVNEDLDPAIELKKGL
jgi:hypothetical protein